jgi:hypothetical protein
MRLHTLQGMNEYPLAFEVHWPAGRQYLTLDLASGPEPMYHPSPRVLRVCAKVCSSIFAHDETRTRLRELQVHDELLIGRRLDNIALPILANRYRRSIG